MTPRSRRCTDARRRLTGYVIPKGKRKTRRGHRRVPCEEASLSLRGHDREQLVDWIANTKLEQRVSLEDYSVSNRGLRAGLIGTPEQVAEQLRSFEAVGVDLLLLQCSAQLEEMERFAAEVMPLVGARREAAA